jgi:hypothetical protein
LVSDIKREKNRLRALGKKVLRREHLDPRRINNETLEIAA